MKSNIGLVFMMGALAACSRGEVSSNSLGITQVQVNKSDTSIEVVGLDAKQARIGVVRLTLGTFVNPEFGDQPFYGRSLTVEVGDKAMQHQSPGEPSLTLPLDGDAGAVKDFLLDARVSAELKAWGVAFEAVQPAAAPDVLESAYYTCNPAPASGCGATACYQFQSSLPSSQNVCCGTTGTGVQRQCVGVPTCSGGGAYGGSGCPSGQTPSCPSGSTRSGQQCVVTSCGAVGPAGCAVCWSQSTSYCALGTYGDIYTDANCVPYGSCTESAQCCTGFCNAGTCEVW